MSSILHLGAGKINPEDYAENNDFLVFVDQSYDHDEESCQTITEIESEFLLNLDDREIPSMYFCGEFIFNFLGSYKFKFDEIKADRVFEHFFYDNGDVGRLLDSCNQITNDDGKLTIVVPDMTRIVKKFLQFEEEYEIHSPTQANAAVLLINTENHNTIADAHGSTWSPALARFYIESEGGTWKIDSIEQDVFIKGRNIYMKIECSKP